ncbi:MAG: hypothetical protein GX987_00800 [Tissierellia bacterium]|nr:hypothetical protein [Tissierellia bacterium]
MFPRSFLFFIIIMIIDIISKSVKDKKKIEKAKNKKVTPPKKGREQLDKKSIEKKPKPLQREKVYKKEPEWKETFPIESYENMDTIERMEGRIKETKTKKSNEKLKKDLLKGIIFSEILTEPKGLKNRRRSI